MIKKHKFFLELIKISHANKNLTSEEALKEVAKHFGRSPYHCRLWLTHERNSKTELQTAVTAYLNNGCLAYYEDTKNKREANSLQKMKVAIKPFYTAVTIGTKWVEDQIENKALDRRLAASLKKKWKFEEFEELRSHCYTWLLHWGKTGYLDEWLEEHGNVKPSVLKHWLNQKMGSVVFSRGKDALSRELTGARTQYELKRGDVHEESILLDGTAPEVVLQQGAKEGEFERHVKVEAHEIVEEDPRVSFARDIIRLSRKRAGDRYVRIFEWMRTDKTLEEIAVLENVSENRASKLTQRVRDDLKKGKVTKDVAKKILVELSEEPFSTKEDLKEELTSKEAEALDFALELLSYRDMITKNNQGCYNVTSGGLEDLTSGELF